MTDEQREQAALYALGLLETGELGAFQAALERDAELAELVREHRAVLAIVSLSPELREPPETLKDAILARAVEETSASGPRLFRSGESESPKQGAIEPEIGPPGRSLSQLLPWALAASLAIGCGFLLFEMNDLKQENAVLAQQANPENFQIAVLAAQSETFPGLSANVAWNATSGTGILEAVSLPGQPAGKTYQLWVFEKGNPSPVSAGIFDPSVSSRIAFQPERPVSGATTFAVSIEVAGGRPQPEGPVVLAGNLQES